MRILHAIHDFLPRHQAGSEIYAFALCRAQAAAHHVTVLCAEYDPSRRHGQVTWRVHEGLPVVELVNNSVCESFEDTYRSPIMNSRIAQVLHATQPEVVHVHNLLNLSFDLPAIARARGIPVVATLHDYTLVCPTDGKRIHRAEEHVCHTIDTDRCVRCFRDSPLHAHISFAKAATMASVGSAGAAPRMMHRAAVAVRRRFPRVVSRAVRAIPGLTAAKHDIDKRMAAARRVFDDVDLFVAPSPSIAEQFRRLGLDAAKIRVSDYGFVPLMGNSRNGSGGARRPLRIGYVGTLVWHKGVHVLLDAVRGLPSNGYELKIFGNPDVFPEYAADLHSRAAGLPVAFMGAFDRGRIAEVYAQLDVLVVPSLWLENSPLVIHEAFMAGVPVVGARIGGIPDLVDVGRTGLLYDPASSSELQHVLAALMDDPRRLNELTQFARNRPRVKSIAEDAQEWDRTYADVLRGSVAAGLGA